METTTDHRPDPKLIGRNGRTVVWTCKVCGERVYKKRAGWVHRADPIAEASAWAFDDPEMNR